MTNEVKFLITADSSGAVASIRQFENQVTKTTQQTTKSFGKVDAAIGSFFGNLAANATGKALSVLRNSIGSVVQGFQEFSSATAEINSILPKTEQLTAKTKQTFVAFASSFGSQPQSQAKAFYGIVSAGVQGTAKQLETLRVANQAAVAGLVDIDTSAQALVQATNAYATAGLTAQEASDVLFQTVKDGQTTFGELAASIGRVAPLANSAGISFRELGGTLAFVTKSFGDTNQSVTGVRSLIAGIIKPASEASKAAEELGINFGTAGIKAAGGFGNFLTDIIAKTGGSADALGTLFPNVNALSTALAIANGDLKDFNQLLENQANNAGATAGAFAIIEQSATFQIDKLKATLGALPQAFLVGFEQPIASALKALNQFVAGEGIDLAVSGFQLLNNAIANTRLFLNSIESGFYETVAGINEFVLGIVEARIKVAEFLGQDTKELEATAQGLRANAEAAKEVATEIDQSSVSIMNSQEQLNATIQSSGQVVKDVLQGNVEAYNEEAIAKVQADQKKVDSEQQTLDAITLLSEARKEKAAEDRELEVLEAQLQKDEDFAFLEQALGEEQALREVYAAQQLAAQGKQDQAVQKLKQARIKADKKVRDEQRKQELEDEKAFFSAATSLANSENKTLAAIGKAAAITQIAIKTPQAVASSFAFGASVGGPIVGGVFAGIAAAAMAAQAAKIAGISGFQTGGIVPGQPSGTDNQLISVAGGEAVLNRGQQTNLFNAINSGNLGGGGDNINITVEAGPAGVQQEQIDNLVGALNDRQEFGNAELQAG
jgi:TP901 family phage tail tape measure protein